MNKQKINNKKLWYFWFTLIELVVVITILAILWTISFVSFSGYSISSRDSKRISDLSSINKSLSIYQTSQWILPIPEDSISISNWTTIFSYQGYIKDNTLSLLKISPKTKDPLDDEYFRYTINSSKNLYQLIWYLEESKNISFKSILSSSSPISSLKPSFDSVYQIYATDLSKRYIITRWYSIWTIIDWTTNEALTRTNTWITDLNLATLNNPNLKLIDYFSWTISKVNNKDTASWTIIKELPLNTKSSTEIINTMSWSIAWTTIMFGNNWGGSTTTTTVTNSCSSTQPACSPTWCTLTTWTPSNPNQSWLKWASNCWFSCNANYSWTNCEIYTDPSIVSCTAAWQIKTASSTYPWCDTSDIIVCSWNWTWYTLAACNVWSTTAWLTSASYWNYFQWWRNKGFSYSDSSQQPTTITWNIWLNSSTDTYWFVWNSTLPSPQTWASSDITDNWWHTTNTSIARKWPCQTWYHVPSNTEWSWILTSWWWWSNWDWMNNALKLPYAWYRARDYYGYPYTNWRGYYWTTNTNSTESNTMYLSSSMILIAVMQRAIWVPVRCIKN